MRGKGVESTFIPVASDGATVDPCYFFAPQCAKITKTHNIIPVSAELNSLKTESKDSDNQY